MSASPAFHHSELQHLLFLVSRPDIPAHGAPPTSAHASEPSSSDCARRGAPRRCQQPSHSIRICTHRSRVGILAHCFCLKSEQYNNNPEHHAPHPSHRGPGIFSPFGKQELFFGFLLFPFPPRQHAQLSIRENRLEHLIQKAPTKPREERKRLPGATFRDPAKQ